MSNGPAAQQESPLDSNGQPAGAGVPSHGTTGEGAVSAMAWLISQEQDRVVPGAPAAAPDKAA